MFYSVCSRLVPGFSGPHTDQTHVPGVLMRLCVLTTRNPVPVGEAAVTILTLAYTKSKVVLNVLDKSDGFYTVLNLRFTAFDEQKCKEEN